MKDGHLAFVFIIDLGFFSFIGLYVCSFNTLYDDQVNTFEFIMPNVIPNKMDINHLCQQILIRGNFYLVGFEPRASMNFVHQMTLYGCTKPGSNDSVWRCREPPGSAATPANAHERPCLTGCQVIYGWGLNATGFELPKITGFRIGVDSPVKYLVLQVHYLRRYIDRTLVEIDNIGVILNYTSKRMKHEAGVMMLGSQGVIPPHSVEHLETICVLQENNTLHPIAIRVHTHKYGRVVSCYVVRQGAVGDDWTTLGKGNPLRAQSFLPTRDVGVLRQGDILAMRCTMNNTSRRPLQIGKTETNEICSLYLVYWAEQGPLHQKFCVSAGPPQYYWSRAIQLFRNIPDLQASIL